MKKKLSEELKPYVNAGCSGVWVRTREPHEVERQVFAACAELDAVFAAWDAETGLRRTCDVFERKPCGPADAVRVPFSFPELPQGEDSEGKRVVVVLHNFHHYLRSPDVAQTLLNGILNGKQVGVHFVVTSPQVNIPEELQTYFSVLHDTLPDADELRVIFNETIGRSGEEEVQRPLVEALGGMTRFEAENEIALCFQRNGRITPRSLWEAKAKVLEKSKLLTLYKGGDTFADVCGMDAIKNFVLRSLREDRPRNPKGIVILGVSGCGKSAIAKAIGNETRRPTLRLDMGSLLNSLVGQSEANLRAALEIAEAMAPVCLFVD